MQSRRKISGAIEQPLSDETRPRRPTAARRALPLAMHLPAPLRSRVRTRLLSTTLARYVDAPIFSLQESASPRRRDTILFNPRMQKPRSNRFCQNAALRLSVSLPTLVTEIHISTDFRAIAPGGMASKHHGDDMHEKRN